MSRERVCGVMTSLFGCYGLLGLWVRVRVRVRSRFKVRVSGKADNYPRAGA